MYDFVQLVKERRLRAGQTASRMSENEGAIKAGRPVKLLVEIWADGSSTILEEFKVQAVLTDVESVHVAFRTALQEYRRLEIKQGVRSPKQLLSTDFSLEFDTGNSEYEYIPIDMEKSNFYNLVDNVLTEETLNNNPED